MKSRNRIYFDGRTPAASEWTPAAGRRACSHLVKDLESPLGGALPTEVGGALESEPFHAGPQLGVQQQIGQGPDHFVRGVGVEQDGGAVDDFRERRGVGTRHGPAAGHRFERGQAEALVKCREYEQVAGVVELEQFGIGDEAAELDAVLHSRLVGGVVDPIREPGRLAGENQAVLELG